MNVHVINYFFYNFCGNLFLGKAITNQKAIITKDIDHTWKSPSMLHNHRDGFGGKHFSTPASNKFEPVINIFLRFFFGQRTDLASDPYLTAELPQTGRPDFML